MFIRIKNAQNAGHETVHISYSKFKHEIAKALLHEGRVEKVERKGKRMKKFLEITLKYRDEAPVISSVRLISKPSRRLYAPYKNLGRARHGGMVIVSTPGGVMSAEEARKAKVGGELIAEVW